MSPRRGDQTASFLGTSARWARFGTAVGFATLSFVVLAQAAAMAWQAEEPTPARPRPLPTATSADPERELPPELATLPDQAATAAPLPSARQILIDLGPPRSEAFVDGRRVGQTPFVGQVKCRPGREILIQVIPERGLPLEEKRVCPP